MRDFGSALLAYLRANRPTLIAFAQAAVQANPEQDAQDFSAEDLGQMVDGFIAVVAEGLADDLRGPTRTMYLETVIPGLVEGGSPPSAVVRTVASWSALVAGHIGEHAPPALRAAALPWLCYYLGDWVAAMMIAGTASHPK